MYNLPVFLAAEFAYDTWGEKLALCGRMLLTGMGTVFLVLALPVPETPPVEEEEEDSGALIAVIMAAIEAYRSAEGLPAGSYRVVSFRKKNTKKSWNGHAED